MVVRVLVVVLLLVSLTACRGGDMPPTASAAVVTAMPTIVPPTITAIRTFACPVTHPNGSTPPGERPASTHHGDGALWVGLWPEGTIVIPADQAQRAGPLVMKFPWWRGSGVRGVLTIAGRRLDAPAPPLAANISEGYGDTGFQGTAIIFPASGCWEVTGMAGTARLTFVVLVVSTAQRMPVPSVSRVRP
jgi:hypothetical protein